VRFTSRTDMMGSSEDLVLTTGAAVLIQIRGICSMMERV
jgi:hypothetical protein